MSGPPHSKTPGSAATGPGAGVENAGGANSGNKNSSAGEQSPAESNVVPFRVVDGEGRDRFEVVETFVNTMASPPEIWVAVAGPHQGPPEMVRGGRKPWLRMAVFPKSEAAEAAYYANELSAESGLPIVDLANIMDTPYWLAAPGDGPEAA